MMSANVPLHELRIQYVRSSGPGGQNVNKTNTKTIIHWNIELSQFLSDQAKHRLKMLFANRINKVGELVLQSDRFRDQKRNFEDCLKKLEVIIFKAKHRPKPRKKVKISRTAKKKRVEGKRKLSEKKSLRRNPGIKNSD